MSVVRGTRGVVTLPALDLRPEPDHRAELSSQLLLGETVSLLSRTPKRGWWRVRHEGDRYQGWVRAWGLEIATATRVRRWARLATATVCVPFANATATALGGLPVSPLFLGSRVIPGRQLRGRRAVELPDARRGWVDGRSLRLPGTEPPALEFRVTSLLGTPYLWGGRTPAGLDCSAFVQLVLAEQGMAFPRDACDQLGACDPLPAGASPAVGDLVFFAARGEAVSHVGIALGGRYFAHSRGSVRIATLEREDALCDRALRPQFRGWFRPKGAMKKRR
jgi:cell wall-associated NlpC family hydrolase